MVYCKREHPRSECLTSQAGLFSASVTAFIIEGYKSLEQDPGDATNILLLQISRQLSAMSNGSQMAGVPETAELPSFRPTSSTLLFNAFWFISLAFSLTCALAATLVQQWARHYLQAIERRPAPHKRARIRAYLFEGVIQFKMISVVDAIPALLHISVFFFLTGLVVFLFPINLAIAGLTLAIAIICAFLYTATTFLPTLYRNCPYRTPLSGICWRVLQTLHLLGYYHNAWKKFILLEGDMTRGREYLAMEALPDRNKRDREALRDTLDSLTEHSELEPFVEGIPGFIRSNEVGDGRSMFQDLLLDRTSGLECRIARLLMTCKDPGSLRDGALEKRALTCLNAIFYLTKEQPSVPWAWISCFGEHTTYVLQTFRYSESPVIAHHACCTAALVVDKLHIDISNTLIAQDRTWANVADPRKGIPLDMHLDRGIYALQFLGALHSLEAAVGLEVVDSDGKALRWTRLLEEIRTRLQGCASDPGKLRRILNKGRIYALVDYVRILMTDVSLPEEPAGLALTIDTLRVITTDLFARHADTESEWCLVRLLAQVIGVPDDDTLACSGPKLPVSLIDVFIRVFATLGDESTKQEARRIIKSYTKVQPASEAVKRVLTGLNLTILY